MLLKGKDIFLLEDDPVNFSIILTILRQHGAHPIHDHWGDTMLTKLVHYSYDLDLILLDIMLPGKVTGYDVFDAIQENPKFQDVPVVAVSASDPDIEIPKAKAKGFQGYISKPVHRHKLPQQLADVLGGKQIWE